MPATGLETEAKFYVNELHQIEWRLRERGAHLTQERILEINIRFDLPGAPLRAEGRVLRLRRDSQTKFTYKSASTNQQGVLSREEIEFGVEDFEKAKRFLEALGYQKLVYYEKYRTTYDWQGALVMLDELPYGNFVEIEAETVDLVRACAEPLGLSWDTAIATSYHALFDRARKALGLSVQELSFAAFKEIHVSSADLGVYPADL